VIDGLAELTLEARDLALMEAFYTDVLGLEVLSREPDRVWLKAGRHARLGLWSPGRKEFGDRGGRDVHYAFSATSSAIDTLADRLRERGVTCNGPELHAGGDRSLYAEDPEGNVVEVWDFFARGGEAEDLTEDVPSIETPAA
jgi:catechol-2,3-dioxygenase